MRSNYFVANIAIKHLITEVENEAYTDNLGDSIIAICSDFLSPLS